MKTSQAQIAANEKAQALVWAMEASEQAKRDSRDSIAGAILAIAVIAGLALAFLSVFSW